MVARPAVPAGSNPDLQVMLGRVPDRGDHVVDIGRLEDEVRVSLWGSGVPHGLRARPLVSVVVAEEVSFRQIHLALRGIRIPDRGSPYSGSI